MTNDDADTLKVRSAGVWMVALGGLLMIVNSIRAVHDPVGFAAYLGLPLASPGDAPLLFTYALRALFIALLVATLLVMRQRRALVALAACAVVMPVGDALLAAQAGAGPAIVLRHAAIAVYLIATALLLLRRRRVAA
jgi:hypothetical protein